MVRKSKKTTTHPPPFSPPTRPKEETEKINPVRKKVSHRKIRKIELLKPLASELSNGVKKTKIRVIGIGGGGGNIVSELAQKVKRATFLAANTDQKALKELSRKVRHFSFGQNFTQGLGTGMNPQLAETAAQSERERIKKILLGQDVVILIACLGGGTASGATPIFAKISRSLGNLTYGIFTLPFKFEGEKKMEIAKISLEKIKGRLNAFSVIPNERIFQIIDKNTPLKIALSTINKNLAESLQGLIETIYEPGLINIDFADLKTILQGRGRLAYLNSLALPKKSGEASRIVEEVINSPFYPYTIRGAKGILFNIAGEKNLSLSDISQISKTISGLSNKEAKIIFGISHTRHRSGYPKYSDLLKIAILAIGCSQKIFSEKIKKPRLKRLRPKRPLPPSRRPLTHPPIPKMKKKKKVKISLPKKPPKKVKIKVSSPSEAQAGPSEEKIISQPETEKPKENLPDSNPPTTLTPQPKIRKTALQVKKELEEEEKEILEKEKFWETPAFLRKKIIKPQ